MGKHQHPKARNHPSDQQMISLLIPIILMVGIYLILNGHISPGGGFQGGAVLCAALVSRYLIRPSQNIDLNRLQNIEKYLYLLLVFCAGVYIFMGLKQWYFSYYEGYLILMNLLIGIKVFCGLSIIFYRFVFYENR